MKLLALIIALALERLATQLFRLRSLRWLDRALDPFLQFIGRTGAVPGWLLAAATVALFVVPVLLARLAIGDALLGLPFVVLSVVVLFFSLGPQDIGEEVDAYCAAAAAGDDERASQLARALLESDVRVSSRIDEAIFVQSNNRMFAVVFWFIVLGPVGAWAVRVADLLRRRAVFRLDRRVAAEAEDVNDRRAAEAADLAHALLAWAPARLAAASYLLVGSFDQGRDAWTLKADDVEPTSLGDSNERLLARVGCAALPPASADEEHPQIEQARRAKGLVFRALWFWAAGVAALTLFGPAI
ncbi:MAG: regulatory signaling modulator protein AmpE [Pseudomonadota bacterium]